MANSSFRLPRDIGEIHTLSRFLSGRYGALALTRAAGEAAAAERTGDHETKALWRHVIAHLRTTVGLLHRE